MLPRDLHAITDCINTGTDDAVTSRALVVFNQTDQPLSGIAVFHADMSWPLAEAFPPVIIRELQGVIVPSILIHWQEGPDRKGRMERKQVSFDLRFAVQDIPPQGWRTYIASYAEAPAADTPEGWEAETLGLSVMETLRHGGDLPPIGTLL